MSEMDENILLKLYKSVEIDKEKLSQLKDVPSTYQWEMIRQNIKFILLFIDKVQLVLQPLLIKHGHLVACGEYEVFSGLWNEINEKYPKYSVLFNILKGLTEDIKFDRENDIEDEVQRYFNFIKSYFSDLYDKIIDSWSNCVLYGDVKLSKMGDGSLYFPDPSVSSDTNKIVNNIYKYVGNYLDENKKNTLYYVDMYFNDDIFNKRNFGLLSVSVVSALWLISRFSKKK
jgi:hypothetical protein